MVVQERGVIDQGPDDILGDLRQRLRKLVTDVKVVSEPSAIDDPDEVAVERLPRLTLEIRHRRMLDLNDDARRGLDVRAVNLAVERRVRNLPA